jgi:C_GCAxxG_C_C family probable redox protein
MSRKGELAMNYVERTVDLFGNGLTCSQAMLTVFGEPCGLDSEMAARLGRPLSGGMGRSGRTCGAVSAAVLILGLAKDHPEESEAKKISFHHVQELLKSFEALHGTTECRDLLGADWNTAEGLKKIQEENLVRKLCPAFVRDAAAILEDQLITTCEPASRAVACCSR